MKFGTLESSDFSIIENLLIRRRIAAPILTSETVPQDLHKFYSEWSDWAEECIVSVRQRLAVSADVRFCLIATSTPNAFATRSRGRYFVAVQLASYGRTCFENCCSPPSLSLT